MTLKSQVKIGKIGTVAGIVIIVGLLYYVISRKDAIIDRAYGALDGRLSGGGAGGGEAPPPEAGAVPTAPRPPTGGYIGGATKKPPTGALTTLIRYVYANPTPAAAPTPTPTPLPKKQQSQSVSAAYSSYEISRARTSAPSTSAGSTAGSSARLAAIYGLNPRLQPNKSSSAGLAAIYSLNPRLRPNQSSTSAAVKRTPPANIVTRAGTTPRTDAQNTAIQNALNKRRATIAQYRGGLN